MHNLSLLRLATPPNQLGPEVRKALTQFVPIDISTTLALPDVTLNELGLPHVSHAEQQPQLTVAHGDHGILGEK